MKLACFGEDFRVGLVRDSEIVDATDAIGDLALLAAEDRMLAVIERFDGLRPRLEQALRERAGIPFLGLADIGHDAGNKVVPFGRWHG